MSMKTVSFRAPSEKLDKLDSLAEIQHRDRTFILNEAIDQYLDLNEYHIGLIEQGLRDVRAGRVVSDDEDKRRLAAQRAERKAKAAR